MTRHEVLQRTDRRCAFPDHPPSGCRGDEAASAWKPAVRHAGGRPSPMGIAASWSWGSRPMPVWMRPWFPVPLATTASRLFAMRWRPCMIIITRSAYHLAEQVRPVGHHRGYRGRIEQVGNLRRNRISGHYGISGPQRFGEKSVFKLQIRFILWKLWNLNK